MYSIFFELFAEEAMNSTSFSALFPYEEETTKAAVLEQGGSNVATFDDFFGFSVQNGYRVIGGEMQKVANRALPQTIGRGTAYESFFNAKATKGFVVGDLFVKAFPKKRFQRVKDDKLNTEVGTILMRKAERKLLDDMDLNGDKLVSFEEFFEYCARQNWEVAVGPMKDGELELQARLPQKWEFNTEKAWKAALVRKAFVQKGNSGLSTPNMPNVYEQRPRLDGLAYNNGRTREEEHVEDTSPKGTYRQVEVWKDADTVQRTRYQTFFDGKAEPGTGPKIWKEDQIKREFGTDAAYPHIILTEIKKLCGIEETLEHILFDEFFCYCKAMLYAVTGDQDVAKLV